jgi:hypothetical protein
VEGTVEAAKADPAARRSARADARRRAAGGLRDPELESLGDPIEIELYPMSRPPVEIPVDRLEFRD